MSLTIEQRRAQFALERVQPLETRTEPERAKYRTQLLKLPARLHTNGLGQTAAYLRAQKPTSAERAIYGWLAAWLQKTKRYDGPNLIQEIVGSSDLSQEELAEVAARYRPAATEARAIATWLKRFAEAFLAEPEEASTQGAEDAA
jgi:CRISPR type III-B/RAMP module-associated protein Cmr5